MHLSVGVEPAGWSGLDLGDRARSAVVGREPNPYAAYYPSEILTCRFGGDSVRRLLMKYAPDPDERYGGHQTGPRYEQLVYEHVLTGRRWSVPAFLGCYLDPVSGALWSATEYLGGGVHPDKMYPQADGLGLAARWVGGFHAADHVAIDVSARCCTATTPRSIGGRQRGRRSSRVAVDRGSARSSTGMTRSSTASSRVRWSWCTETTSPITSWYGMGRRFHWTGSGRRSRPARSTWQP